MTIQNLLQRIKQNERLIIAIDGPSGAGKSTLTTILKNNYPITLLHTDDYFLPAVRKTEERLQEAGGNLDYERMMEEVFLHLKDSTITSNHYNCSIEQLEIREAISVNNVIIVEGVYSMHPMFQPFYDVMIYLDIDSETQYKRILARSNDFMLQRFKTEWIPLEDHYFTTFDIKNNANIIIDSSINFNELIK